LTTYPFGPPLPLSPLFLSVMLDRRCHPIRCVLWLLFSYYPCVDIVKYWVLWLLLRIHKNL
jgi:hypothetical protein